MDLFGQKIYSVAYHFTLKREDAEELAQEIFLKIFENLHRYDGSFPLTAWIVSLVAQPLHRPLPAQEAREVLPIRHR